MVFWSQNVTLSYIISRCSLLIRPYCTHSAICRPVQGNGGATTSTLDAFVHADMRQGVAFVSLIVHHTLNGPNFAVANRTNDLADRHFEALAHHDPLAILLIPP